MTLLFLAGYALAAAPNPCASNNGQGCTQMQVGSFDDISRLSKETAGEVDVLKRQMGAVHGTLQVHDCELIALNYANFGDARRSDKDVAFCAKKFPDLFEAAEKAGDKVDDDKSARQVVEIEKIVTPADDESKTEAETEATVIIIGPGYDNEMRDGKEIPPGPYVAIGLGGFASYRNGDFAAAEAGEIGNNVVTTATGGAGGSLEFGKWRLGKKTRGNIGLMVYGGGILGNGYEVGGNAVFGTQLAEVHSARLDLLVGGVHEYLTSAAYTYAEGGLRFALEPVKHAELTITGKGRTDFMGHWGLVGGVEARVRFGL